MKIFYAVLLSSYRADNNNSSNAKQASRNRQNAQMTADLASQVQFKSTSFRYPVHTLYCLQITTRYQRVGRNGWGCRLCRLQPQYDLARIIFVFLFCIKS